MSYLFDRFLFPSWNTQQLILFLTRSQNLTQGSTIQMEKKEPILDREYKEHDPAVIWTNQRWTLEPVYKDGELKPFNLSGPIDIKTSFYNQPWKTSHLKTFRVRDFKGLNPKNFKDDEGNWIMIACDQAIFLPMLERARLRRRPLMYIPRVLYHYDCDVFNREQFFNDRAYNQKDSAVWIRERGYLP